MPGPKLTENELHEHLSEFRVKAFCLRSTDLYNAVNPSGPWIPRDTALTDEQKNRLIICFIQFRGLKGFAERLAEESVSRPELEAVG